MKSKFHIITVIISIILTISIGINIVQAVSNGSAEPGSEQDPLISKSYVDSMIEKYITEINSLRKEVENLKNTSKGTQPQDLEAVSIKAGQVFYMGRGTEIVLKSGKAIAVKGKNGTITDLTSAKELSVGTQVALNHLIMSSQDDGRGFKTSTQCVLLIRGTYEIEAAKVEDIKDAEKETPKDTNVKENESTTKGKVTASSLNIRAETNTSSKIVGKLIKDEVITIVGKSGEWYRIKTSKGVTGWVMGKYIK